ncbi:MAG: MotA/TolQ/ExbB proton channel family protein [Pseudomonadota bacterium]
MGIAQKFQLHVKVLVSLCALGLTVAAPTGAFAQSAPEPQQESVETTSGESVPSAADAEPEEVSNETPAVEESDAPEDELSAVTEGGEAVDADEATADELRQERDWGRWCPIADLVDAGGPIIVLLAVLSVISLAIVIVKLVQFFILRPGDYRFVQRVSDLLAAGEGDEALDFLSRRRGVVARVMEAALRGRRLGAPDAQVREEAERVARVKLDGLESGLPFLSLIATISPLLGLLGTVLGMIEAFQQLENAGDRVDPAILSGGIWEALLTTAAGLSVAIPAAAFFTWLQRTVDVAGQHMEDAATRVFTADIYASRPKPKSGPRDTEDEK